MDQLLVFLLMMTDLNDLIVSTFSINGSIIIFELRYLLIYVISFSYTFSILKFCLQILTQNYLREYESQ